MGNLWTCSFLLGSSLQLNYQGSSYEEQGEKSEGYRAACPVPFPAGNPVASREGPGSDHMSSQTRFGF